MNELSRRALLLAGLAAPLARATPQSEAAEGLRQRLSSPRGRTAIVLDTDAYNEVDDQFALAYALLSPNRIAVEAIYAGPFVNQRAATPAEGMSKSYDEILRILELMGEDGLAESVYRGSTRYLESFSDQLGSPAAADLIRRAMAPRERPLYVVSLGCPTNVAAAMILEPRIVDRIVVLWIGGQIYSSSNATDFNIKQDYHAAATLYDSGVALVNVPGYLVSEQMRTSIWELDHFLKGKSKIADDLVEIVRRYYLERRADERHPWSKVIWDLATIGYLVNPKWVDTEIAPSPILQPDITWRLHPRRHPVRVATHVDRDAIYDDVFRKLAAAD